MPLIAHSELPTFARLAREGQEVLAPERAMHQDIRELHVGLLNMMPDAALEATERQFMRLVGASNRIAQFYVHLFSVPGLQRGEAGQAHIDDYYQSFEALRAEGLDALIVTGANVTGPDLTREAFFEPMCEVLEWARTNVTSVLCSCLASHAVWKRHHHLDRRRMTDKMWGVFEHRSLHRDHPLMNGVNTRFDAPHSRYNEVTRQQIEEAGMTVLAESDEAGVLLAAGADGFRFIYVQGHPEYDIDSLAKEYKREVMRFVAGDRDDYPPFPSHYFPEGVKEMFNDYRQQVLAARYARQAAPTFPDGTLATRLDNTWADTGKAIFNNWLGLVYQLTGMDRATPFMPGINPDDPLGLRQ